MIRKIITVTAAMLILAGCGTPDYSTKVDPMQKKDKRLSCKEVLLEMNEAEFYRDMAHKNKGPKLKNVLMPLGYISTYMDAEEAIEAAEARVSYLEKIYEIMNCEVKAEQESEAPAAAPISPTAAAPYGYYYPMQVQQ